jgi:hypothetical protein
MTKAGNQWRKINEKENLSALFVGGSFSTNGI